MGTFIDDRSIEEDLQTMWKVEKKQIRQDLLKLNWHVEGDMTRLSCAKHIIDHS